MPQFSLLVRVHNPIQHALIELLDSLEAQTNQDWQLILVVDRRDAKDWALAQDLALTRPQVAVTHRPADELLAWSCNVLLPSLGTWTGFLNQHDQLVPEALATLTALSQLSPQARVLYSNECHINAFGRTSFVTEKGAFDPFRLVTQEYLGALTVTLTSQLLAAGGFDRLASDVPTHDLYLRILEAHGPSAFAGTPAVLCQHHRTYLEPEAGDVRRLPHLVRYDLFAMRQHLTRTGVNAQAIQEHGTARVVFRHLQHPGVNVFLLVDDDLEAGLDRIHALNRTHGYRLAQVQVLHRGSSPDAALDYQTVAKALGWSYRSLSISLPQFLNRALPLLEHDWILVLDSVPLGWGWLNQLMDFARLPGVAAVGGRATDPRRITAPGLLGYRYEGWDWNTRGRFNRMQVPHQTGALGSACFLVSARAAREVGGFEEELPNLWAMELSLRLDQAGHSLVTVPSAHVQAAGAPIDPAEQILLKASWPGWKDRFGLHQAF